MHKITHIIGTDLLNQVRQKLRAGHNAYRTEQAYVHWIERYIRWHAKIHERWRHPSEMGTSEVEAFLSHLAVDRHVTSSTQNQALSALLFLYRHVIAKELGDLGETKLSGTVVCAGPTQRAAIPLPNALRRPIDRGVSLRILPELCARN